MATIVVVAAFLGLWAGSLGGEAARKRALVGAIVIAVVAPLAAATVVPGVAQVPDHRIPGGRTEAIYAAPDGNFDLYLMPDGDPSQLVALTATDDAAEEFPQLDPTGTRIAYTLTSQDGSAVHLAALGDDGRIASDEVLLVAAGDRMWPTAWTPEGDVLVGVDRPGRPTLVLRVDPSTGERSTFLRDAGSVAFSPDGSMIAFAAPSPSDPDNWDIWVADANGSHARDVIRGGGDEDLPAWSPDGRTLLFTSWTTGSGDVYEAAADGKDVRNLTPDSPDRDTSFGWTDDGHVLFLSDRSHTGGVFQYFMNDDGTDVQLALRI